MRDPNQKRELRALVPEIVGYKYYKRVSNKRTQKETKMNNKKKKKRKSFFITSSNNIELGLVTLRPLPSRKTGSRTLHNGPQYKTGATKA